ncbi:unnamed protein product [Euphydryas editha]|uniref:Uncharacterized protein n=1 Tax=Euphydryas editha TaxID=104508 RepID=A0AAU9TL18_EUPED|nr:unnamed protein product [Euphydryas editha]
MDSENNGESRKRVLTSSSSDSECSSRESSPERNSKKEKRFRPNVSDMQFQFLSQQVAFLTSLITQTKNNENLQDTTTSNNIGEDVNRLGDEFSLRPPQSLTTHENEKPQLNLSELSTNIKDPIYAKSKESHLAKLNQIQRFKCNDWNGIRFYEQQKKYLSTPGFVELGVNDELRRFASRVSNENSRLLLLERSFAALSNALISQKEQLNTTLQQLVDWSSDVNTTLNPKSLFDKIESLFSKDSTYNKITDDILQIVCGRRADCIQSRREALLKQIPDEFYCTPLEKIPPTAEFLFDENLLTNYVQKIGGAEKLSICSQVQTSPRVPLATQSKPSTSHAGGIKSTYNKARPEKFFRPSGPSNKGKGRGKSTGKRSYNRNRSVPEHKGTKSNFASTNNNA